MKEFLSILLIIVSLSMIIIILLQSKGVGLGSTFGGGGGFYRSRRGIEKIFVYLTIVLVVLFFVLSIARVLI